MVTYAMEGDRVRVTRPNGVSYALTGEHLEYCISVAERIMATSPNATLSGALAELRGALGILNLKYAVDVNTAWAQMGVKGGAM